MIAGRKDSAVSQVQFGELRRDDISKIIVSIGMKLLEGGLLFAGHRN
jgi:hypothetical protein